MNRSALVHLAALVVLAPAADAVAAAYSVGARTEAQVYQLRSWAGRDADDPELLGRYRLVQYLDLGAFDLTDTRPGQARLDFVTSLRLENDFGFSEEDQNLLDPEAEQPEVHLLYGYLRWSRVAGGVLDFQLGRQIRFDELQFYSFDGLDVAVHTPAFLGVGVFGGWQVKGTSILGSATFAPDGTRVSDRRRIDDGATTDLLSNPASAIAYDYLDEPSPIFGARLQLENVRDVDALFTYRRAMSKTSGDNLDALPEEAQGWQVDVEHAGGAARVRLFDVWELRASADFDLFRDRWAALRAGTRVELVPYRLAVDALASRYNPSFDADSIWNLFATGPRDEYTLRADWGPPGWFRFYGGPLLTVYNVDLGEGYAERGLLDPTGSEPMGGAVAGFGTRPGLLWRAAVDVYYLGRTAGGDPGQLGYLGRELWVSGAIGRTFRGRHSLDLRLSLADVADPWGTGPGELFSFGAAILGRTRLTDEASLLLVLEDNINRFSTSDVRGYAVLDILADFR